MFMQLLVVLLTFAVALGADGEAFTLIDSVETECEYQGLTWGSRLADAFNSGDESASLSDRLMHPFLSQSPSFSKMLRAEMVRRPHQFTQIPSHHLHASSHRLGAPAFASMDNRWIYLIGDSSLHSVWNALRVGAVAFNKPTNAEQKDEECFKMDALPPRKTSPSIHITVKVHGEASKISESEVCHVPGFGTGKLSYERRDLLLEDLTPSFFSAHPILSKQVPDLLVVQPGFHTCTLSHLDAFRNADRWDHNVETTATTLGKALQDLKAQWKESFPDKAPRILVSLPGRMFYNETTIASNDFNAAEMDREYDYMDSCLWKQNGLVSYLVHQQHIPVFAREEIEHRLLLKHEYFFGSVNLQAVVDNQGIEIKQVNHHTRSRMHELVEFPGAQIVTAALVEMLHCMDRNHTFVI